MKTLSEDPDYRYGTALEKQNRFDRFVKRYNYFWEVWVKKNWLEILSVITLIAAMVVALMYNPNPIKNFWETNIRVQGPLNMTFVVAALCSFFVEKRNSKIFLLFMLSGANMVPLFPKEQDGIFLVYAAMYVLVFSLIFKGKESIPYKQVSISVFVFSLISTSDFMSDIWHTTYITISFSLGILAGFLVKEGLYYMKEIFIYDPERYNE